MPQTSLRIGMSRFTRSRDSAGVSFRYSLELHSLEVLCRISCTTNESSATPNVIATIASLNFPSGTDNARATETAQRNPATASTFVHEVGILSPNSCVNHTIG
jgi:hypothetical protein